MDQLIQLAEGAMNLHAPFSYIICSNSYERACPFFTCNLLNKLKHIYFILPLLLYLEKNRPIYMAGSISNAIFLNFKPKIKKKAY